MSHTPKLMEEIMVQVPQEIAEIYRQATENERQQMAMRIGVILKNSMRTRSEALAQLRQTMDEISAEAIDKGLTPEILESILKSQTTLLVSKAIQPERSLADFYGVCADDPIVVDDEGISAALDDDMEGFFD